MGQGGYAEDGRRLPAGHASLARGVPGAAPGVLYALALGGGVAAPPREGHTITFGRRRRDVQVCVGGDDHAVSRHHGLLERHDDLWWVRTVGRLPVRLGGGRLLFQGEDPVPLPEGYTPLFLRGSYGREHLLELYVTGPRGRVPVSRHDDATRPPRTWRLDPDERLALVALGRRYLLHEAYPQPLAWRQAAELLGELRPGEGWTAKRVEHMVTSVRARLSRGGVAGLTRDEVGEPVGNLLNHNLIHELMASTTLVPTDLRLLDNQDDCDVI